ncbi:MAG: hypothetical protein CMQ41_04520 [Gammaproteobacteria bacterium]|nr:hypothetical protein [Gammaproteobacteria bacterium]
MKAPTLNSIATNKFLITITYSAFLLLLMRFMMPTVYEYVSFLNQYVKLLKTECAMNSLSGWTVKFEEDK